VAEGITAKSAILEQLLLRILLAVSLAPILSLTEDSKFERLNHQLKSLLDCLLCTQHGASCTARKVFLGITCGEG